MKLKEGFMLREIAGSWIIVPLGERVVEFKSMMTLNGSAALIWKQLESGADFDGLVTSVINEYDVDEPTARADVEQFVSMITKKGLIES